MRLLVKPHICFWVMALLITTIGLINYKSDQVIDINIHDTYFVFTSFSLEILISSVLSFVGLVYYMHEKLKISLVKPLTSTHTIITLGCFVIYFIGSLFIKEDDFPLFNEPFSLVNFLNLIILLGVAVQTLFVFNSLFSSFKHIFRKS